MYVAVNFSIRSSWLVLLPKIHINHFIRSCMLVIFPSTRNHSTTFQHRRNSQGWKLSNKHTGFRITECHHSWHLCVSSISVAEHNTSLFTIIGYGAPFWLHCSWITVVIISEAILTNGIAFYREQNRSSTPEYRSVVNSFIIIQNDRSVSLV